MGRIGFASSVRSRAAEEKWMEERIFKASGGRGDVGMIAHDGGMQERCG